MRAKGFTLIELMIVVAVIGILAAIAYPAYTDSINKSRRADGRTALLDLQNRMEKFRGNCAYYPANMGSTDTCGANSAGSTINVGGTTYNSSGGYYAITIVAASGNSYTIRATPQGAQANDTCTQMNIVTGTKTGTNCW